MIRGTRGADAHTVDDQEEINENEAVMPMTLAAAFRIVIEERDPESGKTMTERMDSWENDSAQGRRLHQIAMKLCQYGIELVKQQFDREKFDRMAQGMRKNRVLQRADIPVTEEETELLDWIYTTVSDTLDVLRGEAIASRRHTELALAPALRNPMISLLGQEFGEFALVRQICAYVFYGEDLIELPSPLSLNISPQDYLRGIEDAIGELIDAYHLFTASDEWAEMPIRKELAIEERLYRALEAMRDFMEQFRDYDDDITRNMPNPLAAAGKDGDRDAIRKMSQPLRLRLKGVDSKLAAVRIAYLSKLKEVKLAEVAPAQQKRSGPFPDKGEGP